MSPQELINNLASLQRRGALDQPEIKALVDEKLASAKTAKRVSALKAEQAIAAGAVSEDLRQKLEEVADAQVKAKGRIARPTALFIDKSGSMEVAIELGKRLGALIKAISREGTGVLLVEHHADLIFDICDRVTVLNLGKELAAGTPAEIRAHREVVSAYLGA